MHWRADGMSSMSDVLVFITATINCGQTPDVKRTDPEERQQDYLTAFRAWMSLNCDADIVFCENSQADLAPFREEADKHTGDCTIRLLSFAGNDGAQQKGKGYGEIEMLRYAFNTLPDLQNYRYIIKVSGRYRISNGPQLIEQIRKMSADLICDVHAYLTYGDTRTVAFTPHIALTHLLPYRDEIDDTRGVIIEHLMAKCLHRTLLAGGSWAPLPCTPLCDGISGSWNTPQRDTLAYRVKQNVKRKLARWIYRY
jgi:hypothetical protein